MKEAHPGSPDSTAYSNITRVYVTDTGDYKEDHDQSLNDHDERVECRRFFNAADQQQRNGNRDQRGRQIKDT